MNGLKIFSGNANIPLAENICQYLGLTLGEAAVGRFSDGETSVEFRENVRGADVFVVQPTSIPANDHLMELLIMMDALRRASAGRITAVVPYYAYARQDRKTAPRVPISAKLVANSSPPPGPTGSSPWTCTPGRFRVFSIFRWTISMPRR